MFARTELRSVHTEPPLSVLTFSGSANQNPRLFTLLALFIPSSEGSFEGNLDRPFAVLSRRFRPGPKGPFSAPAIVAARPVHFRHFPVSHFHFPASLSPFRPLPLRAPKSRRINTYEIPCMLHPKNLQDR